MNKQHSYLVHVRREHRQAYWVDAGSPHEAHEKMEEALENDDIPFPAWDSGEVDYASSEVFLIRPVLSTGHLDYDNDIWIEGGTISRRPGAPYYVEEMKS